MTSAAWLPVLILLLAFSAGVICLLVPERNRILRNAVSLTFAMAGLITIGIAGLGTADNTDYSFALPFLPQAQIALHIDALSILFLALTGALWLLTSTYAIGYLTHYKNKSRFFGFVHLSVAATLGIALSANLITFVIFYELLTLATFPLVAHKGDAASLNAVRIYLRYTITGGVFLLAGAVWLSAAVGPLPFTPTGILQNQNSLGPAELTIIFTLLIVGLAVKAAIVPLHGWLPVAMAAPAPVSALLHAVAVVKAGAFGIVRVVYDIFGIEYARELGLTFYLGVAASITIIYGSVLALRQKDIKKRLAYSTVSQVSYIALGTAIAGPIATIGGLIHLVHQGLMKITLFFCAGILAERLHVTKVHQLDGAGAQLPLPMLAFTVASLGMIGVPPVAGFVSKWYLSNGAIEVGAYWVLIVLAVSSLLNACYFLPLIYRIWFKATPADRLLKTHPYSALMTLPAVVTALAALLAGLLANLSISPLNWAKLIAVREYTQDFFYVATQSGGTDYLLLWVIVIPLIWLLCCLVFRAHGFLHKWSAITALPIIALALLADGQQLYLDSLFLSTHFSLTPSNQYFLLLCGIVWFGALLYARGYLTCTVSAKPFFIWSLLAMAGNIGLILADDYFSFITFYTLMSLASYGLVIFTGKPDANVAARSYIRWAILAELLLFAGFSLLSQLHTGSEDQQVTTLLNILLIIGFGIKLGVAGLHFWLPLAHPAAPVPASAVLSGVMVKAGLIGMLKFLSDLPPEFGPALVIAGTTGIFAGALLGLCQQQPKAILAYSTISQMGIITTALGAAVMAGYDWAVMSLALALFCFHHGLVKSALFFSVAAVPAAGQWRPLHWLIVIFPAASLPGLPFTSAMLAKTQISPLIANPYISYILTASAFATTVLMIHFVVMLRRHATFAQPAGSVWLVSLVLSVLAPFTLWLSPHLIHHFESTLSLHLKALFVIALAAICYYLLSGFIQSISRPANRPGPGNPVRRLAKLYKPLGNWNMPELSVRRHLRLNSYLPSSISSELGFVIFVTVLLVAVLLDRTVL
ncbi:complex I subunit 5 family protein [Salinimonas chungwhensis]|uniref:complex I subunit 5 family protein n=1 Tax=Salinimonas chungwhensis TaxID=265425 RepID=UPI00037CA2EE|nr:proton-conducting transporter membrane subunit [Salinimonas chungwhensis]